MARQNPVPRNYASPSPSASALPPLAALSALGKLAHLSRRAGSIGAALIILTVGSTGYTAEPGQTSPVGPATVRSIASKTPGAGYAERSVRYALRELEREGVVVTSRRTGPKGVNLTPIYQIILDTQPRSTRKSVV